jgi:hypothetical protein
MLFRIELKSQTAVTQWWRVACAQFSRANSDAYDPKPRSMGASSFARKSNPAYQYFSHVDVPKVPVPRPRGCACSDSGPREAHSVPQSGSGL